MKYIILFLALFIITIQAQDIPSGYTTNLGLRLYDLDDYPGADSLNANSWALDVAYKKNLDSINAILTDLYTSISYSGLLKAGVVGASNLAIALDTNLVKSTGNDAIYGNKYFYGSTYMNHLLPIADNIYWNGHSSLRWYYGYVTHFRTEDLIIYNQTQDDSGSVTYDNDKFTFNKQVEAASMSITESLSMDSAAAFQSFQLTQGVYTFGNIVDSVVVCDTALYSNLRLELPGVMANVSYLEMPAPIGFIVILYNTSATDSVTLVAGKDYMKRGFVMASDITLASDENAGFMMIQGSGGGLVWMNLWKPD